VRDVRNAKHDPARSRAVSRDALSGSGDPTDNHPAVAGTDAVLERRARWPGARAAATTGGRHVAGAFAATTAEEAAAATAARGGVPATGGRTARAAKTLGAGASGAAAEPAVGQGSSLPALDGADAAVSAGATSGVTATTAGASGGGCVVVAGAATTATRRDDHDVDECSPALAHVGSTATGATTTVISRAPVAAAAEASRRCASGWRHAIGAPAADPHLDRFTWRHR